MATRRLLMAKLTVRRAKNLCKEHINFQEVPSDRFAPYKFPFARKFTLILFHFHDSVGICSSIFLVIFAIFKLAARSWSALLLCTLCI